jgi:hypothetical protein
MISSLSVKYRKISKYVVFFSMLLIAVSLFFSRFLISFGFILLVLNWAFEGRFKEKFSFIKENKTGFYIVLSLLLHIIGLIYTENMRAGINDVRFKSFLFIIVAYGSGTRLSKKYRDVVFYIYILSALLASFISSLNFYVLNESAGIEDLAGMPLVGGNLFQAIMIVFAISLLCYFLFFSEEKKYRVLYSAVIVWFVFYLFLLNSLTGYVSLLFLFVYSFIYSFFRMENSGAKLKVLIGFLSVVVIVGVYVGVVIKDFYRVDDVNFSKLPKTTVNGNKYLHDTISRQRENGYLININICEKELRKEWNARSNFNYDGLDEKKQNVSQTLMRYLSSKKLTKDSVGVWALQDTDIKLIEIGYANYLYTDKFSLKARLYIILWQLDKYFNQGFADRQTISQRLVYMEVAEKIIADNFWLGVGPGDVLDKSKEYTVQLNAGIGEKYTSRVHNQFLVEFVGLGVFGFVAFSFMLFYPYLKNKMWNDYLFTSFYLIVLLSFFIDNLFEAQLGITFFAFFYSLLFFGKGKRIIEINKYIENV